MCGIDNGFEDREGHQAPFTLPIADCRLQIAERKENVQPAFATLRRGRRSTFNAQRSPQKETDRSVRVLDLFNRFDDCVEVRPVTGFEFGMEELAIGANLESAAARRNERERLDALAELKNFGRQTDGLRRVVSNHAVFDRYLGFHLELLSNLNRIDAKKAGQGLEALDNGAISLGRRGDLGMKAFGIRMGQPPFFLLGAPIKDASTNCYVTVRRRR